MIVKFLATVPVDVGTLLNHVKSVYCVLVFFSDSCHHCCLIHSTKVASWKSHGEGEGSDCCSWDGVECDRETGHVIGLHLGNSCLYGSINSSSTLLHLIHLEILYLSDNDFNFSKIPHAIGQLSRLRSLSL